MDKENIFSKLNSKDYNNALERIIENKDFSITVKNLLLSMLYKIEAGFKDYVTVKKIVEDKKTYIEEILQIIKDKCNKIIILEEDSEKSKELEEQGTKFLIDRLEGEIYLMYPNESLLLYTIYKMNNKQVYLEEKYNIIRNSLSGLLNSGENINNTEVLRDFNGWNWNIEVKEIPEISTNIIYQNLIYLLGTDIIKNWVHTEEIVDYIEIIKNKLSEIYGEEIANDILRQIYKISIIICTQKNKNEKERLNEEKETLQKELNRLINKKELLNEISNTKKSSLEKIKEIDKILNDKELLEEEYIKRNEKRKDYNKIFNISHLTEILNKERKKLILNIEENNKLLLPNYYVEVKQNLEKQLELLEDINITENEKEQKKYEYLILLQKLFIKCLYKKIENVKEKEEIIRLIYVLRYYNQIYITDKIQIKDDNQLKEDKEELEKLLIEKAYELKVLNKISNDNSINNEIIRKMLLTKIIKLENINIELKKKDSSLEISFYDTDIYEKTITIESYSEKELIVKLGKTIKLFN